MGSVTLVLFYATINVVKHTFFTVSVSLKRACVVRMCGSANALTRELLIRSFTYPMSDVCVGQVGQGS